MTVTAPVFLPTEEFKTIIATWPNDWYEKMWRLAATEARNCNSQNRFCIASACLWEDGIISSAFALSDLPAEIRVISRLRRPIVGLTVRATMDGNIICLPPNGSARQKLFEAGTSDNESCPTLAWLVPVQPGNVPYTKLMGISDLLPMAYRLSPNETPNGRGYI